MNFLLALLGEICVIVLRPSNIFLSWGIITRLLSKKFTQKFIVQV